MSIFIHKKLIMKILIYKFEKIISNNDNKIKTLESRLKDAEFQATEATKRVT